MSSLPNATLNLEWVYGYRGHQCRNNLVYNKNGELVYFVAGVGVVFDVSKKQQKYYFGHNDDIISLGQHPDEIIIGTGQVGKHPYICIWNTFTLETVSILKDAHEHGIAAMAFSRDGTLFVSVGSDQSSTIVLWEWTKGRKLAVTRGHSDRVFDVQFCPQSSTQQQKSPKQHQQQQQFLFATCGVKHIKFWTHSGNTLTGKKGIFGNVGEIQTMLSLVVCNNNKNNSNNNNNSSNNMNLTSRRNKDDGKKVDVDGDDVYTLSTTLTGDVYAWSGCTLKQVYKSVHVGAIFSIVVFRGLQSKEGLLTGGRDGLVKLWDFNFQPITTHNLKTDDIIDVTIRSLHQQNNHIIIGTKDSEIMELSFMGGGIKQEVVMCGHGEGELWGLAVSGGYFATGSDDKTLRIWDGTSRTQLRRKLMERGVRCCSFNHDASMLAVGMLDGYVAVVNTKTMSVLKTWKDRKEVIHEMKHSPDGRWLAVGSNDNFVDVYDSNNNYKRVGVCTGNSSFITHLDWSVDGRYIVTNSGAAERLIFNMPEGKQVTNSDELKSIKWLTFTGVLGNEVKGIWQKYTDTNDVNATDVIDDVIATADDFGLVKLFRFPCYEKGAKHSKYIGHSAHVTNCRFTKDGQSLLSVGGADHAIFQWQYNNPSNRMSSRRSADVPMMSFAGQSHNHGYDGDDDDDDDAPSSSSSSSLMPIDSDIERENEKTYERQVNKKEVMALHKMKRKEEAKKRSAITTSRPASKPSQRIETRRTMRLTTGLTNGKEGEESKPTNQINSLPDASLLLDYVIGYRGFDCRNNLFYLRSTTTTTTNNNNVNSNNDSNNINNDIVFHTAAVAVVYNKEQQVQRFYPGHDDDILSLAVHPVKDIVATGQIGKSPSIHVWDGVTMKTLSILKSGHEKGICALDFSGDGRKLASVGLDDNHCIVVWDWRKGSMLASTRGHKDKIYMLKWNPHDANKLVTVGNKHIKFWSQAGNGFNSKRGVFGNITKQETVLCVAYGNNVDNCFSAGNTGLIHCWKDNNLLKVIQGHQGPVFSMYSSDGSTFVTGGKDGTVITWSNQFNDRGQVIVIDSKLLNKQTKGNTAKDSLATRCIRSAVNGSGGMLLVGTKEAEVMEVNVNSGEVRVIGQGHEEGELWGLATHPTKMFFATTSDDCTLRLWSAGSNPTMVSMKYLDRPSRSVAFSHDGGLLAVGMTDGSFSILTSSTLTEKLKVHKRKQNISDLKFSPDPGKYLAVGSHDNFVDIYSVVTCQLVGVCKSASSYITHIDWNKDGTLLQVNTGASEQLFYECPRGTRVTPTLTDIGNMGWATFTGVLGPLCVGVWPPSSDVTDINSSCLTRDGRMLATGDDFGFVKLFSFPVKAKHSKHKRYMGHSAHVTNVRWMCDDRTLVSIGGDDTSILVWKLVREGHESHEGQIGPMGVEGSGSMNGVVGGLNQSRKMRSARGSVTNEDIRSNVASFRPPHHNQPIQSEDSNSDDDDDDHNVVDGYDSDVEREANIDYVPKFNMDPLRNKPTSLTSVSGGQVNDQVISEDGGVTGFMSNNATVESIKFLFSRQIQNTDVQRGGDDDDDVHKSKDIKSLQLQSVYGYRGVDTRNNLQYLDHLGSEVVYHTAAAAVVVDVASGRQRFYLGHHDDVICLATNQNPRFKGIVATGDIGERPTIHVWQSRDMITCSVLSGVLIGGVGVVDFSCGGKLLVAVGVDEEHTIVVYNWVDGTHLATSPGHHHRIFHCEYRPDSDSSFVTVGINHIRFWSHVGNALVMRRGIMTSRGQVVRGNKKITFLSLAFGMNNTTYSGSISGDVYIWRDVELVRVVQMVHKGPIFSMFTSLFDGLIVTGGKERNDSNDQTALKLWDQTMDKCKAYNIPTLVDSNNDGVVCVKSVCRVKGKLLIGTKDSNIFELNEKTTEAKLLASYHGDGELWGLTNHPNNKLFATAGDDGMLKVWDLHKMLSLKSISIGPCRSIHYNSTGSFLAAGLKNGGIKVFEASTYNVLFEKRVRGSVISVIKFSPDNKYLVTLSEDSSIDIYDVDNNDMNNTLTSSLKLLSTSFKSLASNAVQLKRLKTTTLHNSIGISVDFSDDNKCIKIGTDHYINRYFQIPSLTELLDSDVISRIVFSSVTSVSGPEMIGAWPRNSSSNHHVNCCHVSRSRRNVVTGDDFGLVKLLKFPASEKNTPFQCYVGHSAHVSNILFTDDQHHVISTGGDDSSILVWQTV